MTEQYKQFAQFNTPVSSNGDVHQYLNIMMSNVIFKQLASVFESDNITRLTSSNIIKLLTIMSLDEIRKIFMSAIKSIFKYISENYVEVFQWINNNIFQNYLIKIIFNVFNRIIRLFKKNEPKCALPYIPISTNNYINMEIKPNIEFLDSLIKYIKHNKSCKYNVLNSKKMEMVDLKTHTLTETWSNIEINYNDIKINIYQTIENTFDITKSHSKIKNYGLYKFVPNVETVYDSVADLIFDDKIRKFVEINYNMIINDIYNSDHKSICNTLTDIKMQNETGKNYVGRYHYGVLSYFKFKDYQKSVIIMSILYSSIDHTAFCKYLFKIANRQYPCEYNYSHGFEITTYVNRWIQRKFSDGENSVLTLMTDRVLITQFIKKCTNYNLDNNSDDNSISTSKMENIKLFISGECTEEKINITFNDFIKEISSYIEPSTQNKKIKVNIIKIKKTKIVNSIPNPEYISYEEQKENIKELGKTDELAVKEFLLKTPPVKTIETIEIKKQVVVEQINEVYKSFETLYLRKQDHDKLKKVLHSFMHQMELYEELGLPNKLNVFLSGLPGTGKSSIIQVIASCLQKNIYYCNISDDMSNDDIQMIFDYVIKNSIGGGIIVTEDVDAMTKVVHKRIHDNSSVMSFESTAIESTTMEIHETKDKSLTLEYLLNLLQGSLTQDGTIFIATTNHKDLIDPAFYRDGRFDVKIDMKLCDRYQINCIYRKFMNRDVPEDILARISEDTFAPANIIFRVKDYICSDLSDEAILEPFIT